MSFLNSRLPYCKFQSSKYSIGNHSFKMWRYYIVSPTLQTTSNMQVYTFMIVCICNVYSFCFNLMTILLCLNITFRRKLDLSGNTLLESLLFIWWWNNMSWMFCCSKRSRRVEYGRGLVGVKWQDFPVYL